MERTNTKVIAVVGATGRQGGAVVRALTRDPAKHRELADEVIQADLNRPETLKPAFAGAHGVFLVTNFGEEGIVQEGQRSFLVSKIRRKCSALLQGLISKDCFLSKLDSSAEFLCQLCRC